MAFQETLSTFLADFAATASSGSLTTPAIFDAPDHSVLGGRATSKEYAITYQTGQLGAIGYNSVVTLTNTENGLYDGQYKVLTVNSIDDGQFERATLEKT